MCNIGNRTRQFYAMSTENEQAYTGPGLTKPCYPDPDCRIAFGRDFRISRPTAARKLFGVIAVSYPAVRSAILTTMDEKPNRTWRRWFQFRLSTWLVLVGIVAWAMATRPYVVINDGTESVWVHGFGRFIAQPGETHIQFGTRQIAVDRRHINPRLRWPALALTAFIGWKAFWLIPEIRRENRPTH